MPARPALPKNGPDDPYTLWFTGFAPAESPQVVVTVVVEDGGGIGQNGTGNQIAAPIAKAGMKAALKPMKPAVGQLYGDRYRLQLRIAIGGMGRGFGKPKTS